MSKNTLSMLLAAAVAAVALLGAVASIAASAEAGRLPYPAFSVGACDGC